MLAVLVASCIYSDAGASTRQQDSAARPERLAELWSVGLPVSVEPRGAAIAGDYAVVLWTDTALWLLKERRLERVESCGALDIVAADFVGGAIEVLQRSRGTVVRVHANECQTLYHLDPAGDITAGARARWGWGIAVVFPDGSEMIAAFDQTGMLRWRITPTGDVEEAASASHGLLSASGEALVASAQRAPHRSQVMDSTGRPTVQLQATSGVEELESRFDWVGLRVLRVSSSYLQVLADLRSDERVIVRFDNDGQRVSTRGIGIALGLMASASDGLHVVALRRTDLLEVVVYQLRAADVTGTP